MKRKILSLLLSACMLLGTTVLFTPLTAAALPGQNLNPDLNQWELTFEDEFDGNALDTTKWSWQNGNGAPPEGPEAGWGNHELEIYRESNTSVAGSQLTITANNVGGQWYSSKLRSIGKFSQAYGRFEARIKLPETQGFWPAFWMLPADESYGGWAASGEIDILEAKGRFPKKTSGAIHYGGEWPTQAYSWGEYNFPGSESIGSDFHVYTVEWEPSEIRWYVDGNLFQTRASDEWWCDTVPGSATAPFDRPFYMILNLAVGGDFDKDVKGVNVVPPTGAQGQMVVDWVRTYQRKSGPAMAGGVKLSQSQITQGQTVSINADVTGVMLDAAASLQVGVQGYEATFVNCTNVTRSTARAVLQIPASIPGGAQTVVVRVNGADSAAVTGLDVIPANILPPEGATICLISDHFGLVVGSEDRGANWTNGESTLRACYYNPTGVEQYCTYTVTYVNGRAHLLAGNGKYVTIDRRIGGWDNPYKNLVRPRTTGLVADVGDWAALLLEPQPDGTFKICWNGDGKEYIDVGANGILYIPEDGVKPEDTGKFTWCYPSSLSSAGFNAAAWNETGLMSPRKDELSPCGQVDIRFSNVTSFGGTATSYTVYVDNTPVATVPQSAANILQAKWYNSDISEHDIKIVANGGTAGGAAIQGHFFLTKKGIAYFNDLRHMQADMGFGWHYNWGVRPSSGRAVAGTDYVPMVWWPGPITAPGDLASMMSWEQIVAVNEPDLEGQVNLPVAQVLPFYTTWFTNLGRRVSSPVVAWQYEQWLKPFMQQLQATGKDVDFITVHDYGQWTGDGVGSKPDFNKFKALIDGLWETYHKPIWITELGLARWPSQQSDFVVGGYTQEEATAYMTQVIDYLNNNPHVERYAWFSFGQSDGREMGESCGSYAALVDRASGQLTDWGRHFRETGNPPGFDIDGGTGGPKPFVAVTDITGAPSAVNYGTPLTLYASIIPNNATKKTITWSLVDAGTTGATLTGSTLNTTAVGTVTVKATITDGAGEGIPFTKDFAIKVNEPPPYYPVTDIIGVAMQVTAGTPLALTATVVPSNASSQSITWSVKNAGGTGAAISGNTLSTSNPGTVTVTATIQNGIAAGTPFTKDFTIVIDPKIGGTPTDNLAYRKNAYASSFENVAWVANNVTDGIRGEPRWGSAHFDDQWIYVDLEAVYSINKVIIAWEAAYASAYEIQVSTNGTDNWTPVKATSGINGVQTVEFDPVNARYVRLDLRTRATGYGFSLFQLEVYGIIPDAFVPVAGISGVPTDAVAGTPLTLTSLVTPGTATNKAIVWSVANPGTTGASVTGNTLNTTAAGTVTVTATIANGAAVGTPFTKDFTIKVEDPSAAGVAVTGFVKSYNPGVSTDVKLMRGNTVEYTAVIGPAPALGSGQKTQSFNFTNVAPGEYSLVITKDAHTSFTVQKITVGSTDLNLAEDSRDAVKLMTLLCGDISGDDMINDGDLAILWLAANYNKNAGDPGVNQLCDLNGDGMINDGDLAILWLAVNYNKGAVTVP